MKIHKEQDVDAKLFWYVVSALLIITYITAGLVIMFSSLLDDGNRPKNDVFASLRPVLERVIL